MHFINSLETQSVKMNYIVLLLTLQIASVVYASSFGRYRNQQVSKQRPNERHKRMHYNADCMFNICEHVPNYPATEVEQIIKKHTALHSYFGGSIIEPSASEITIHSRNNKKEPPVPFCKTKDTSTMPKEMVDIDGVKRSIANVDNYSQVLKFQICDYTKGEQCYPGNTLGFQTACVQKFNDIKLVTVNFENEILEYRKFRIPSTCICTYTKDDK